MELPELGLGAVSTRQVDGEEKGASSSTGCGQSPGPPPTRPRPGVEEQLLQAGDQGWGAEEGPQGTPDWGGGTCTARQPHRNSRPSRPSDSDRGHPSGNSRAGTLGDAGPRGRCRRGQSPKPEGRLPCWELRCPRGDEAEGPGELCALSWAARLGQGPLCRKQDPGKGHASGQPRNPVCMVGSVGGRVDPSRTSTPSAQGAVVGRMGRWAGRAPPRSRSQQRAGGQRAAGGQAGSRASVLPGARAGCADSPFSIWK